jgi:hypothetical protein
VSVRDREEMVVARLQALAPHLDGEPDPAFRAATRARLVAMAAVRSPAPEPVSGLKRLLAARPEEAVRPRWRTRLTASLAGAALTVTAAASLVALADGARPGDVLYGLKRGTEQAQLALAGDARGTTLLGFASTRLDELQELVDAPSALPAAGGAEGPGGAVLAAGADPELVISTLETMDDQTTEGTAWLTDRAVTSAAEAPVDELSDWVVSQTDGLAALAPQLPDAAGAAVSHSLTLLSEVATRADALQVALNCSTGPAVGAADELGPTPAPCLPAAGQTPDSSTGGTAPGTGATGTAPSAGAVPTPSGSAGSGNTGSGGGSGALTSPATPTVPGLPKLTVPTVPGGLPTSLDVPTGPLPRSPLGAPASGSLGACLPPLPKIGDC